LVVLGIAAFSLLPLYWILVTSLKVPGKELALPVQYWPRELSIESYRTVVGPEFRVQRAILNSLIVSGTAMLGTLFLGGLSAYAIARFRFRSRFRSLLLIQAAGMVPPIIVIAPTFILIRAVGLLGTLWAMILPNMAYGIPLASLLLTAYFTSIPNSLEDAARIDGASSVRIFWQIMIPVAAPGLFSAGLITFLASWGEFMHALTVSLGLPEVQTVPVAILSYSQAFNLQWTWISAASVVSIVPVVLLVLLFQRSVVRGLTAGSIQG
jgi:ABC-type glycerol-3-phosphate transport system permease component